jgi:hypothetical protein
LLVAGCTGQIEPELNPCESMIVLALVLDERGVVTHDSAGTVVLQWAERRTIAEFQRHRRSCGGLLALSSEGGSGTGLACRLREAADLEQVTQHDERGCPDAS